MKTRMISASLFLLFSASAANAQFGFQAGTTFSSYKAEFEDESNKSDMKTGYTIGVAYRTPISSTFSFQPELNYLQKGGKQNEDGAEVNITLNYIEIPLYFFYTGKVGSGFFIGAGPSLNFAASGKYKYNEGGFTEEGDLKFGTSQNDYAKEFHLSINAQAGYKFNSGININAFISQSISNSSNYDDNEKLNLFTLGARVGYFLSNTGKASDRNLKPVF